jgi:hypothetical protein
MPHTYYALKIKSSRLCYCDDGLFHLYPHFRPMLYSRLRDAKSVATKLSREDDLKLDLVEISLELPL